MNKYVAFAAGSNSGIMTKDKAVEWARTRMGTKQTLGHVQIAEVVYVVKRTQPSVEIIHYEPSIPKI